MLLSEGVIEKIIEEAVRRGEFDNLPGAGKPLDLEDWAGMPAELRMMSSVLKNNNVAPLEVQMLKDAEILRREAENTCDPDQRAGLLQRATHKETQARMMLEVARNKR